MQNQKKSNQVGQGLVRHSLGDGGGRAVGVVGARSLGHQFSDKVGLVVEDLLSRGFRVSTGGAIGADEYCLSRLVHIGYAGKGTIYAPWKDFSGFPAKVRALVRQFKQYGGSILWGDASGREEYPVIRTALLARNLRLIEACHGITAFLHGESRGSLFTLRKAVSARLPIVVFAFDRALPEFPEVRWKALKCGGCWEGGFKAVYLK